MLDGTVPMILDDGTISSGRGARQGGPGPRRHVGASTSRSAATTPRRAGCASPEPQRSSHDYPGRWHMEDWLWTTLGAKARSFPPKVRVA